LGSKVPKVSTVIEFDLGRAKDINYLIIEGATEVPFMIEQIVALAPDGHKILLLSDAVEVNSWERISFDRVLASAVQITFSMKSYIKVDYAIDPKGEIWEAFVKDNIDHDETDLIEAFGPLALEVLGSPNLGDILNIPVNDSSMLDAYLYPFALDNIWFGNGIYQDSGIFVSKPLRGQNFGLCAVEAKEETSTIEAVSNSIEYEIIRKDLSPKYTEVKFSIPSLEQTTVTTERLILTKKITDVAQSDAGALRFCPQISSTWEIADGYPVRIYKNGVELPIGIAGGFDIAISLNITPALDWKTNWSEATDFADYTLMPQKMWIKIRQPDPTAVYTASYTIRTSDTSVNDNTVWLDKDKSVFLISEGKACFRRENPDAIIESELYLQITMRKNTASKASTPILNEYTLLGATYYN